MIGLSSYTYTVIDYLEFIFKVTTLLELVCLTRGDRVLFKYLYTYLSGTRYGSYLFTVVPVHWFVGHDIRVQALYINCNTSQSETLKSRTPYTWS